MKSIAVLALALLAAPAFAQHAHNHGVGQLGIVVEGELLTLPLDIPQHDLVGFERPAQTAREQQAVQVVLDQLGQPARLGVYAYQIIAERVEPYQIKDNKK
ncbi:MAG: DUF2796 domain-containing protein [Burkholderiaceae bacterium]|jgi:hypothetical protein|nr:DUF2796 domain-containing protein [Burkholderiaceae bacterium]